MVCLMEDTAFDTVFSDVINSICADAKAIDVPMTEICLAVGVSRASLSRWRRKTPETVERVALLQAEILRRKAALATA